MRAVASLAGLLLLVACNDAGTASCTIVTNGTRAVYEHELAHCNGWDHEAFVPADPPSSYVHAFDGQLTLIECGRRSKIRVQPGTIRPKGCTDPRKRCIALWQAAGYDVSAYTSFDGWRTFNGCMID
jgi:hypothetical protein